MTGSNTSSCTANGTLAQPSCSAVICLAQTLKNGNSSRNGEIQYQDSVTFTCDDGYNLIGAAMLICTENGTLAQPLCSASPTTIPTTLPTTSPATIPTTDPNTTLATTPTTTPTTTSTTTPTTTSTTLPITSPITSPTTDTTTTSATTTTTTPTSTPTTSPTTTPTTTPFNSTTATRLRTPENSPGSPATQVQGPAESHNGPSNIKNIDGHPEMVSDNAATPTAATDTQGDGLSSQKNDSGDTGYITPNASTHGDITPNASAHGDITPNASTHGDITPNASTHGDGSDAATTKNNTADGDIVHVIALNSSNPQVETEASGYEIAGRNNSNVVRGSPTTSKSSTAVQKEVAQNVGEGNNGDEADDRGSTLNLALLFSPLVLAGCMILAFAGIMARRRGMQKQESVMTAFEPIKKTIQEPSSWDRANEMKLEQKTEAAPLSDRSSVRKPHTKDVAHLEIGDFPVYLRDDASYIEQDIDALANELGEPQPKRMAMSPSTVGSYSVQSFKADEMQFSNREDARSTPSNTAAGIHVSRSPTAVTNANHALQLERRAVPGTGRFDRPQTSQQRESAQTATVTKIEAAKFGEMSALALAAINGCAAGGAAHMAKLPRPGSKRHTSQTAPVMELEQGDKEYAPLAVTQSAASRGRSTVANSHVVSKSLASQTAAVTELGDKEYEPLTPHKLAATTSASHDKSPQLSKATRLEARKS
ncbi:mucin-5AC-like [Sycon ciliatum]|uniref:mucin-5AC-like n=1 Tax=Sycon ciliatum TaxID=27933 RepID=UPI0031F607FD